MRYREEAHGDRRQFLASIVPLCGAACILDGDRPAAAAPAAGPAQHAPLDVFDQVLQQDFTYSRFFAIRYRELIQLARALEQEWGRDRLIAFLKKNTEDRAYRRGQNRAQKLGDTSLLAFATQLRPPAYKNLLVHRIVQDSETVFEIRVTRCIWAKTFREAEMADVGYAHLCHGDFSSPRGFNPALTLVRDKTLMLGHECCNHRYVVGDPSAS